MRRIARRRSQQVVTDHTCDCRSSGGGTRAWAVEHCHIVLPIPIEVLDALRPRTHGVHDDQRPHRTVPAALRAGTPTRLAMEDGVCDDQVGYPITSLAESDANELLLIAAGAVDSAARLLIQGRSHLGGLIAKGDRDYASRVDFQIEDSVRDTLAHAVAGHPVPRRGAGRSPARPDAVGARSGRRHDQLHQGQPAVRDLPRTAERRSADLRDRRPPPAWASATSRRAGGGRVSQRHAVAHARRTPARRYRGRDHRLRGRRRPVGGEPDPYRTPGPSCAAGAGRCELTVRPRSTWRGWRRDAWARR